MLTSSRGFPRSLQLSSFASKGANVQSAYTEIAKGICAEGASLVKDS